MENYPPQEVIFSSSPPPASPPKSPRFIHRKYHGAIFFNRSVRPIRTEMNLGHTDYLTPLEDGEILDELEFSELKKLMLNPKCAPEVAENLIMYHPDAVDFIPAHIPQFSDTAHLDKRLRVFIKWLLMKEVGAEMEERELLQNLGPWIDPGILFPLERLIIRVKFLSQKISCLGNTNALVEARVVPPCKQLQITTYWEEGKGKEDPLESVMDLWPRNGLWMCPFSGQEVNTVEDRETPLFRTLMARPLVPINMSVLFWNSRGISRPEFKNNFRHLLDTHNPDIAVLVETRTCKQKTSDILREFHELYWHLVPPVGFVGGILIMWNPERVGLHIMGGSAQGVHALVEGFVQETE
ncbi:uncharacterized protein LOC109133762 [Beta vulgaris subsp. vulgaris]|uniref:uncharacterized protein LOC109133762 n=1 Tax=Beta vulgaris subsp. vulgaris TaxID=3555 RepID=UPI002036FD3D|nr:uncharacterized protein LOC109133762 [Beta vulgaris subsp. vulgaris]